MAAGSRKVAIDFVADIAKAEAQIDRLKKKIASLNQMQSTQSVGMGTIKKQGFFGSMMDSLSPQLARFASSIGMLSPAIASVTTALGPLGVAAVALTIAFLGVKKFFENIFKQGNMLEQSKIALKSVYGNEKQAINTLHGMREFSRKTQFTPDEVMGPTTRAALFGVDVFKKGNYGLAKDKTVMDMFGGMASMPGMNGQKLGLDRIVNTVVAGRDIRPMKALGPEAMAAWDKAKTVGKSGSAAFTETLIKELAKVPKYMALANEQADSMKGLWSTITGYAEEFFMDVSGAGEETGVITFWSQIKDILKDVRDGGERFFKYIGPYAVEFGAVIGTTFKFMWEMMKRVWEIVGPVLIPAFKIFVQLVRVIFETFKAVLNTAVSLARIIITIVTLPIRMLNTLLGISLKIEDITRGLMGFVAGLQTTFMLFDIFITGVADKIKLATDYLIRNLENFIHKYQKYFDIIGRGIVDALPGGSAMRNASGMRDDLSKIIPDKYKIKYGGEPAEKKDKSWAEMSAAERFNKMSTSPGSAFLDVIGEASKREKAAVIIQNNKTENNYNVKTEKRDNVKNANRPH